MTVRLAFFAALCAALAGAFAFRRPTELHLATRRFGRAAARSVTEDWDALFI